MIDVTGLIFVLGIYSKGLRSRSFGRYTREKPRSGSSRTPSSHGWPDITWLRFFGDIGCGSKLERKVNGQQTTCQCEFLLQYHCMTLWHCCVFLCIILLSLVFISLMNQSLDVQMPWPSSAQEEKFQFFRQGFLVKWRYIWDHSTVSVVLGNLHAELSIVRDSQTEDPRTQFVYACLFVVRALRSLRPARTCATKLLRDFNLHLQPSMPRSWSKLRGWNRWVTNRSWFIQSTIVTIVSF